MNIPDEILRSLSEEELQTVRDVNAFESDDIPYLIAVLLLRVCAALERIEQQLSKPESNS